MSLTVKLAVGTLTLGSIGSVTYGTISYFQQGTEITKLIEQEFQYVLLDTKDGDGNRDQTKWKEIWQDYKKTVEIVLI